MFILNVTCWADESLVYQHTEKNLEWKWTVNPSRLTTGMQTQLSIVAKVLDGFEVNLSSELKGGDFGVSRVMYLPKRWESPYWVHELKATLTSRLPGEYTLPNQTIYLVNGAGGKSLSSSPSRLKVTSLIPKNVMDKDDLNDLILEDEHQEERSLLSITVLLLAFLYCVWRLMKLMKQQDKVIPVERKVEKSFENWIHILESYETLSDSSKSELFKKFELCLKSHKDQSLITSFENLRFGKAKSKLEWIDLCRACSELERTAT